MKGSRTVLKTSWMGRLIRLSLTAHPNKIQEIARKELIKNVKPHDMTPKERLIFQCDYWELQKKTEDSKKDFLSDRSLLDILAYDLDIMKRKDVYAMLPRFVGRYDVLCYIPIEFPLIVDNVRFHDISYQHDIDYKIRNLLDSLQQLDQCLVVKTLKGTVEQRTNKLKDLITNGVK